MINLMNIHQFATAFQQQTAQTGTHFARILQPHEFNRDGTKKTAQQTQLDEVHAGVKRLLGEGGEGTAQQGTATSPNPDQAAAEHSTDWRAQPEYNPHGLPVEEVPHPFPVQRARMSQMVEAARGLAAEAESRIGAPRTPGVI